MPKYKYTYMGDLTVNLPLHGILANGGDQKTVYESDMRINHPDFHEIKNEPKRKESKSSK